MISKHTQTCFVALKGKQSDGHRYINQAIAAGAIAIISENPPAGDTAWFQVKNTLQAYQQIAKYHREQTAIKLLAITGSNGKTIVKEWLSQMIEEKIPTLKSPKSYNSQIGVAYSLLEIEKTHELAIIETGVSTTHEMEKLEEMIAPDAVIFTNIGDAHEDGFENIQEKIREKLLLARKAKKLFYCFDHALIKEQIESTLTSIKTIHWGYTEGADMQITKSIQHKDAATINLTFKHKKYTFLIPLTSDAELENAMHVICYLLTNEWSENEINEGLNRIKKLSLRLEKFDGINQNIIINDSYSSDFEAFKIATQYLINNAEKKPTIIITNGLSIPSKNKQLLAYLHKVEIDQIYWIGKVEDNNEVNKNLTVFENIATLRNHLSSNKIENSALLIKGSNKLKLGQLAEIYQERKHKATLSINLGALGRNINELGKKLNPNTKIMASIKAAAYGSGASRIAKFLENRNIDYLAVAYIDEAIELRKNNINLPILIFNFYDTEHISMLKEYTLEVVVYSFEQLELLAQKGLEKNIHINIHIEFDTGMHRLGFNSSDVGKLMTKLNNQQSLRLKSVFSHLASSDIPAHKAFTEKQLLEFNQLKSQFQPFSQEAPIFHILNSNGIWNYPSHQHDMVRLGIAMYGVGINPPTSSLEKVHALHANIIQIKSYNQGDSIGYSRSHILTRQATIATVNIGYADGIPRNLGGKWHVHLHGQKAKIVGRICMDLLMIDVTDIPSAKQGDPVEIFGENASLDDLSNMADTIPYEILARISPRIRRLYVDN